MVIAKRGIINAIYSIYNIQGVGIRVRIYIYKHNDPISGYHEIAYTVYDIM